MKKLIKLFYYIVLAISITLFFACDNAGTTTYIEEDKRSLLRYKAYKESQADPDGDGLINQEDNDDDDDGYIDGAKDRDGNGIPDYAERSDLASQIKDADNDGIPDMVDMDDDNDGKLDGVVDTDGDGIPDKIDHDLIGNVVDTDGDGIPNMIDQDDDDGLVDGTIDTDGDGIADLIDEDANDDGLPDTDTDGDGIVDVIDFDIDDDGITEVDTDNDGTTNDFEDDVDGDGEFDWLDDDTDGDGVLNDVDTDDNADGLPDAPSLDIDLPNRDLNDPWQNINLGQRFTYDFTTDNPAEHHINVESFGDFAGNWLKNQPNANGDYLKILPSLDGTPNANHNFTKQDIDTVDFNYSGPPADESGTYPDSYNYVMPAPNGDISTRGDIFAIEVDYKGLDIDGVSTMYVYFFKTVDGASGTMECVEV